MTKPDVAGQPLPGPAKLASLLPCRFEIVAVAGTHGFIMHPRAPMRADVFPWVWYAPVLPDYPVAVQGWYFRRLLEAGIAIAGVDVGESYGNPAGRRTFTAFWQEMCARSFSRRPILLPQSRGGLMLYNWGAEHPDGVGAVAGIYTVCDPASWPGVNDDLLAAYGMTRERFLAARADHTPLERLQSLANARVPILHIHGDDDAVVPMHQNAEELLKRYRAIGGSGDLIVVPGKGHAEIAEFFENQRFLAWIIAQARRP